MAAHRQKLADAREHTSDDAAEVLDARLHVVDRALEHDDAVAELRVVKSKLSTGEYEDFPVGSAIATIADETFEEEIRHEEADESLVMKLEAVQMSAENIDLVNFVVDRFLLEDIGDIVSLANKSANAFSANMSEDDIDRAFKARTTESLLSHAELVQWVVGMQEKTRNGTYKFLNRFEDVAAIVEESLREELGHQMRHEALMRKVQSLSASGGRPEAVAKTFLLNVLSESGDAAPTEAVEVVHTVDDAVAATMDGAGAIDEPAGGILSESEGVV